MIVKSVIFAFVYGGKDGKNFRAFFGCGRQWWRASCDIMSMIDGCL